MVNAQTAHINNAQYKSWWGGGGVNSCPPLPCFFSLTYTRGYTIAECKTIGSSYLRPNSSFEQHKKALKVKNVFFNKF